MYPFLLSLHSILRWAVLLVLLYSLFIAFRGWFSGRPFGKSGNILRSISVIVAHLQATVGVILYFKSPIVGYFVRNFSEAVHTRDPRFFGMEHVTLMVLAVVLITIGSSKVKRKNTSREKFKTMAIWYAIALFIIFISIPWPFSPFTSRPYIRLLL